MENNNVNVVRSEVGIARVLPPWALEEVQPTIPVSIDRLWMEEQKNKEVVCIAR